MPEFPPPAHPEHALFVQRRHDAQSPPPAALLDELLSDASTNHVSSPRHSESTIAYDYLTQDGEIDWADANWDGVSCHTMTDSDIAEQRDDPLVNAAAEALMNLLMSGHFGATCNTTPPRRIHVRPTRVAEPSLPSTIAYSDWLEQQEELVGR